MEQITISSPDKKGKYEEILHIATGLIKNETDLIANMANISSILKEAFGFLWVGFYLVRKKSDEEELVLGPFQGSLACTRIGKGKGVCGTSWALKSSLVVPDVDAFPGHIACSSLSRSEIVVPIMCNDEVIGVLDIDSREFNTFDDTDKEFLEQLSKLLGDTQIKSA